MRVLHQVQYWDKMGQKETGERLNIKSLHPMKKSKQETFKHRRMKLIDKKNNNLLHD